MGGYELLLLSDGNRDRRRACLARRGLLMGSSSAELGLA